MTKKRKNLCIAGVFCALMLITLSLVVIPQNAFASSVNSPYADYFGGGEGTATNPYLIRTEEQLNNIRRTAKYEGSIGDYAINYHFKLTNNISLVSTWDPIPYRFLGTFDGNNYSINNLVIYISPSNYAFGLFASIGSTGKVINLNISNLNIFTTVQTNNSSYVGAIAGFNYGTITNCNIYSGIIDVKYYYTYVGGLVGINASGQIAQCSNNASISGAGSIGGIAGSNSISASSNSGIGKIDYCINSGTISYYYVTKSGSAGGIAGLNNNNATVKYCTNTGKIRYASESSSDKEIAPCMGQIIGWLRNGQQSTNTCSGSTDYSNLKRVGGFLGIGATNQARYCSTGAVGLDGEK